MATTRWVSPTNPFFPKSNSTKSNATSVFDITIVTTARTNEEAKSLLSELGMPFSDKKKPVVPKPEEQQEEAPRPPNYCYI